MKVDLHIHTAYSDGVFTPEKVVETAINEGLECIALTDHDNVLSYAPAVAHAKKLAKETGKPELQIIQGVEINTIYKDWEVHILGYFMDVENNDFKELLKNQQAARVEQTKQILKNLASKENIHIKYEDLTNDLDVFSGLKYTINKNSGLYEKSYRKNLSNCWKLFLGRQSAAKPLRRKVQRLS